MYNKYYRFLSFLILVITVSASVSYAQETVGLKLGRNEIGENENFSITLTIENGQLKDYSGFPEITSFRKGRPSTSTSTTIINGKVSTSQSIIQYYSPTKKGTFRLNPFTITVNGKKVNSKGTTIKVTEAKQRQNNRYDPFADFWGQPSRQQQPQEFKEVKADAFFAVSTDKNQVYRGEGFNMSVAFYVATTNKANMEFYKIGEQLADILKEIKPYNCWEENFNIESVNPEYVTINGKSYRQYKIYEANFYPLNTEDIKIPKVGLKMIKYKVATQRSFFGRNQKEDFKTFYSKAKTVKVIDLPPHPLKDKVSVGNYRLKENISQESIKTGQSLIYKFKIEGEGHISAIGDPSTPENDSLFIYPPSVRQNITRGNGRIYGSKSFDFYLEPQEPGTYQMDRFFEWVYFNPKSKKYESLKSEKTLTVTGESKRDEKIKKTDLGGFYSNIENANNDLKEKNTSSWFRIFFNVVLVGSLAMATWIVFKK